MQLQSCDHDVLNFVQLKTHLYLTHYFEIGLAVFHIISLLYVQG